MQNLTASAAGGIVFSSGVAVFNKFMTGASVFFK